MSSTISEDGSKIDIAADAENQELYPEEIREIWRTKKAELENWLLKNELKDMTKYREDTICFYKKRNFLFERRELPDLPIDQFGVLVNVLTNLQLHLTERRYDDEIQNNEPAFAEYYKQADPTLIQRYIGKLMYEMNQLSSYNDLEMTLNMENILRYFQPRLKVLEENLRVLQESGSHGEGGKEFEDYELMAVFYSSLEDIIRCLMGETCQPKKA